MVYPNLPKLCFLLLGNNFCPELTRKHVSNAYYSAELESELEENCQKSITFFRSDQDKNRVMAEIEERRVSKPYVHHQTDMCLQKGILYLYQVSLLTLYLALACAHHSQNLTAMCETLAPAC